MLHSKVLMKENIDAIFECFAKNYIGIDPKNAIDIYLVGGGAIMLNFDYRLSTIDFDAYFKNSLSIKQAIKATAIEKGLPDDWLNQDFVSTPSFSPVIQQHSVLYRVYENKVYLYILEPLYLIAMKLKSSRPTGGDLDDIVKMIYELRLSGSDITFEMIMNAYYSLYIDSSNTIPYFFDKTKKAFDALPDEMNAALGKMKGYEN